jgi:hypothetical protein
MMSVGQIGCEAGPWPDRQPNVCVAVTAAAADAAYRYSAVWVEEEMKLRSALEIAAIDAERRWRGGRR